MINFLTLKYHYKTNDYEKRLLRYLCHLSKNIYNASLYKMRQEFFEKGKISSYFDYNNKMKSNENFHLLNTYQSICIIRSAHNMMSNFVRYRYKKEVKIPRYLPKEGYYPLYTDQVRPIRYQDKQCIKLPLSNLVRTNNFYHIPFKDELIKKFINELNHQKIKEIYFPIPKIILRHKIHQVRIVSDKYGNEFNIEFSYEQEEKEIPETDEQLYAGIDIGINNLASIGISNGKTFLINGRTLKSINQFYYKKKSYLQSKLPKEVYTSKAINNLDKHHHYQMNDYLNKAVNTTLKKSLEYKVKHIVIGYNKGLKNKGIINKNLKGKKKRKVNQTFCSIPLSSFIHKLEFKLNQYHLDVKIINESYTSLASFLDYEEAIKKDSYQGTRIYRGLYKTRNGKLINADINGAYNILAKSNPEGVNFTLLRDSGLTIPYRVQTSLR